MSNSKSFSLIEVLVAITVIMIGLIGVMGLIIYNLSISRVSPERVIAVNLAQEGIEIVRNIRDGNLLAGQDWNNGLKESDCNPYCILSVEEPDDLTQGWELDIIGAGQEFKRSVYYDPDKHYYGQIKFLNPPQRPDRWQSTPFTRWIEISEMGNETIDIISRVSWTDHTGTSRTVTIFNELREWYFE